VKRHMLIGPAILLLCWITVTSGGIVRPLFLPSPKAVGAALYTLTWSGPLGADVGTTLFRTGVSFAISAVVGLCIGLPLGIWKSVYRSLEIVLDFFRSLPSPAIIPLAMLVLGLGDASRIFVAAFTCSLINAVQTAYAISSIPRHRVLAARLSGAHRFFLVKNVLLPSVMPGVIAGWRITLSLSLIIIVVTEMFIGTRSGLGMRIYDFHLMFRSAEMYSYIIVVGTTGYLLNKGIETAEKRLVHWAGK